MSMKLRGHFPNITGVRVKKLISAIPNPVWVTSSLPNVISNATYTGQVTATGQQAVTYSLVGGNPLPTGLTLNATTGAITGKPTVLGARTFTIRATDRTSFTDRTFTIIVNLSNNFAVLTPMSNFTLDTARRTATRTSNTANGHVWLDYYYPSDRKTYIEVKMNPANTGKGFVMGARAYAGGGNVGDLGSTNQSTGWQAANGRLNNSGITLANTTPFGEVAGDVYGIAYDGPGKKFWIHRNGVWLNGTTSAHVAAGTNQLLNADYSAQIPAFGTTTVTATAGTMSFTVNFGNAAYVYTPPNGFAGLVV